MGEFGVCGSSTSEGESNKRKLKDDFYSTKSKRLCKKGLRQSRSVKEWENDNWCWECHQDGEFICCEDCPRVFHVKCANLDKEPDDDWLCNVCQGIMQAENLETRSRAMRLISVDQLCGLLRYIIDRLKKIPALSPFSKPVDPADFPTYPDVIIYQMNYSTLEKNVKCKLYGSTEGFVADAMWILHNSIVFNGTNSKITSLARTLVKVVKQEVSEIETCPDCYENAHKKPDSWFTEACRLAHPLVWAKLKGFPFWPAKAVKWTDCNVDVRFFGRHDRSWLPIKDCFLLSERMPTALKSKNKTLDSCLPEVSEHVEKLKERFGSYQYADHRVPFNPHQSEQVYSPFAKSIDASEIRNDLSDTQIATSKTAGNDTAIKIEENVGDVNCKVEANSKRTEIESTDNELTSSANIVKVNDSNKLKLRETKSIKTNVESMEKMPTASEHINENIDIVNENTKLSKIIKQNSESSHRVCSKIVSQTRSTFRHSKSSPDENSTSLPSGQLSTKSEIKTTFQKEYSEIKIDEFRSKNENFDKVDDSVEIFCTKGNANLNFVNENESQNLYSIDGKENSNLNSVDRRENSNLNLNETKNLNLNSVDKRENLSLNLIDETENSNEKSENSNCTHNDKEDNSNLNSTDKAGKIDFIPIDETENLNSIEECENSNSTLIDEKKNSNLNSAEESKNSNLPFDQKENSNLNSTEQSENSNLSLIDETKKVDLNSVVKNENSNLISVDENDSDIFNTHDINIKIVDSKTDKENLIEPMQEDCDSEIREIISQNDANEIHRKSEVFIGNSFTSSGMLLKKPSSEVVKTTKFSCDPKNEDKSNTLKDDSKILKLLLSDNADESSMKPSKSEEKINNANNAHLKDRACPTYKSKAVSDLKDLKKIENNPVNCESHLKNGKISSNAQSKIGNKMVKNRLCSTNLENPVSSPLLNNGIPNVALCIMPAPPNITSTVSPHFPSAGRSLNGFGMSKNFSTPNEASTDSQAHLFPGMIFSSTPLASNSVPASFAKTNSGLDTKIPRSFSPSERLAPGALGKRKLKASGMRRTSMDGLQRAKVNGTEALDTRIRDLKMELENKEWLHRQETIELCHNADVMLIEMRANLQAEGNRKIRELQLEMDARMNEMRNQMELHFNKKLADALHFAETQKLKAVEETKKTQWCANCGQKALFFCCWNTSYCDYPCQEAHWPQHMSLCVQTSNVGSSAQGISKSRIKKHF